MAGKPVSLVFTPHLLPMKRGILSTAVVTLNEGVGAAEVSAAFHGVSPALLPNLFALAGRGDEAPGVPGIGEKTAARLVLKAEEDIRRLAGRTRLLIAAGEGGQFKVPDTTALDKHSRKLLERFAASEVTALDRKSVV